MVPSAAARPRRMGPDTDEDADPRRALAALATPTFAATFAVTNATGADYDEFYLTVPGQKPSEKNLLKGAPEKSFENGMTYTFKGIKPGTYDVHVYDPEDPLSDCTYKAVTFRARP